MGHRHECSGELLYAIDCSRRLAAACDFVLLSVTDLSVLAAQQRRVPKLDGAGTAASAASGQVVSDLLERKRQRLPPWLRQGSGCGPEAPQSVVFSGLAGEREYLHPLIAVRGVLISSTIRSEVRHRKRIRSRNCPSRTAFARTLTISARLAK
jgi:hypothetical protein